MRPTCVRTVPYAIPRRAQISLSPQPRTSNANTSRSRRVSSGASVERDIGRVYPPIVALTQRRSAIAPPIARGRVGSGNNGPIFTLVQRVTRSTRDRRRTLTNAHRVADTVSPAENVIRRRPEQQETAASGGTQCLRRSIQALS